MSTLKLSPKITRGFLIFAVPIVIATSMYFFYPNPSYEVGKEFLRMLIDMNGILFGIGGIFATFFIKNAYDVRGEININYEKYHGRPREKKQLVY